MPDEQRVPARSGDLRIGRLLHEDDDFVTVEIAKRDDVSFLLNEGDRFLTFVWVHEVAGRVEVWDPFA